MKPKKETKKTQTQVEKYYIFYNELCEKYGKVALMLQNGGFYEVYCENDYSKSNAQELCRVMNISLNIKDSRYPNGPRMGGMGVEFFDKYRRVLLENEYTVVVVGQVPQDKYIPKERLFFPKDTTGERRAIIEIVSPGSNLESERTSNNVFSILVDYPIDSKINANPLYSFHVAVTDTILSREIFVSEFHSTKGDRGFAVDNLVEMLLQYSPVECLIVTKFNINIKYIIKRLGITCPFRHICIDQLDTKLHDTHDTHDTSEICLETKSDSEDESGEIELNNVKSSGVDTFKKVNTRYYSNQDYAIITLKQFLHDRFINVSKIEIITREESKKYLDLSSTAISQLNLEKLFDLLNCTVTRMGSRFLWDRLSRPLTNVDIIKRDQDFVHDMDHSTFLELNETLKSIIDFDRIYRRLSIGCLTIDQFSDFYNNLVRLDSNDTFTNYTSQMVSFIKATFRDTLLDKTIISNKYNCIINNGINQELDQEFQNQVTFGANREYYHQLLCNAVSNCNKFYLNKDGTGFVTTNTRAKIIKDYYSGQRSLSIKKTTAKKNAKKQEDPSPPPKIDFEIMKLKNNDSLIYNDDLQNILNKLETANENIHIIQTRIIQKFFEKFYEKFQDDIKLLSRIVALYDFYQASWTNNQKLRLEKPEWVKHSDSDSDSNGNGNGNYLECTGLRHLIVEHLNPETEYITNDILFDKNNRGLVLYGVNSSGKTCLLKATALAVIMAHSGLFVPCKSMNTSIFHRIMTRIAGGDNMEKSQSSFLLELDEIFPILQRADSKTLVLGDEMCRGTDTKSAMAINYSLLHELLLEKINFISATHLHELNDHIKEFDEINIRHMKVDFDKHGNAIYERKLQPGSGPDLYGLEIARNLNFPKRFMETATKFRNSLLKKKKGTKYNSLKVRAQCELCHYAPKDDTSLPLVIHHINFQCNAIGGFHGTQKVHSLSNLITLCQKCHVNVHANKIELKVQQGINNTRFVSVRDVVLVENKNVY